MVILFFSSFIHSPLSLELLSVPVTAARSRQGEGQQLSVLVMILG